MAAILDSLETFALDYPTHRIGQSLVVHADGFAWLSQIPQDTIHAVVTDPPDGVKEYEHEQLEKPANGKGGIWRIPPSFDGSNRQPLPRFTALNPKERKELYDFCPGSSDVR
jgi:site-specific DNA-methyltransferase (adenine-specific)